MVDYRAYEYIQKSRDVPCVRYQIKINQSGKTSGLLSCMFLYCT